jgi:signal transduction histidine kinase
MRLNKKQWLVMQLAGLLLITGAFLLVRPLLAQAVSVNPNLVGAPMSGSGQAGDPLIITTCEQLQDIVSGNYKSYVLANDIDCSATSGWNSGAGFIPIGSNSHFSGELDGHGHTISDITINSTDDNGNTGLFAKTDIANIRNFSVVNASVTGNGKDDNGNAGTGGIIGMALRTNIDRISFEGSVTHTNCSLSPNVGGIIGRAVSDADSVNMGRASSRGTITVNGTNCGNYTAGVGGIIGLSQTQVHTLHLYDVYSQMDITLNGNQQSACTDGHCRSVGGIIGAMRGYDQSSFYTGYSAGSITITDSGTDLEYKVGGIIGNQFAPIETASLFTATSINLPNTCEIDTCGSNERYYGALVGNSGGVDDAISNFWFDNGIAPNDSCYNNIPSGILCTAYNVGGSDPDFMKGNTTNGALGGFNFASVWQVVAGDYPVISNTQPAYPNTITNLSANVVSETAIELTWTPANTPSELFDYVVLCKKSSETVWNFCKDAIPNNASSTEMSGLLPGTSYDYRITPRGDDNAYAGLASNIATGTTATPGFTLISNCQDLQNINNDLAGYYELSRNIDCSDTATWNDGTGFDPIGSLDYTNFGGMQPFSGIFKGNNYTISNLYSDQTSSSLSCALFSIGVSEFIIQDINLDNLTCLSSMGSSALIGAMAGPGTVTNAHATNSTIAGPNVFFAGGLVGAIQNIDGGDRQAILTKSSFQGTIDAYNPAYLGGMLGGIIGDANVQDNYSNATITAQATTVSGGFSGGFALADNSIIKHNYATGSLDVTSSDANLNQNDPNGIITDAYSLMGGFAGLIYGIENNNVTITENFTHTALSSQSPENVQGGFVPLFIGQTLTPPSVFDNYFDADLAGSSDCVSPGAPMVLSCTGISGQPNYFKNNNTNAPLNAWDFNNIWMTTSELPVFGTKVTAGITTIPPERLNPPVVVTPPAQSGGTTTPVADNPVAAALSSTSTSATANTTSAPTDETGVLGAIKHFVRSLPLVVVVGFPYALFGLLFLAVIVLLLELLREMRRAHILEALIQKQQLLAEERDAFWHLAANYLRAPVTLIAGGAEALRDMHAIDQTSSISALATSLQTKVGDIMKKIEGSVSLQSISKIPRGLKRGHVRRSVYLVPIAIIGLLVVLANYAASSYRNINPGTLGYLVQALIFISVAVGLYWALSYLTQGKKRRQMAEEMYERQTTELANARHDLINDTATTLAGDTNKLDMLIKNLPAGIATTAPGALATLREGTDRLREIVHSFELLIKVQGADAIATSTVDLGTILSKARAKLTPQIASKNVRVMAPAAVLSVSAESEMAQQVIDSIVSNAVDYSPAGGTVNVETRNLGDQVQVRITDQGQGISKDQLAHLFQPFVRADGKSAMDMSHGGFGINLYLDKLIMEKLGGTIEAASAPGKGTAITLTWPS